MFTFVNGMKEIKTTNDLWETHSLFKSRQFDNRYFALGKVENALLDLPEDFNLKTEGFSVLKKPIRSVCFGNGKTKVLLWSQMHGNETTTTKAVFDVLNLFEKAGSNAFLKDILANCTLKIIPVLNPDGAEAYTRENANKIDLNRDAQALSQPESRILDAVFKEFKPDFCFNLHDQRSIYSVGNQNKSAIVSFLSPAMDAGKTVDKTRKISMHHIVAINECLQKYILNQVGRYDDSFNPNCVGDKFQSLGVPTLLFEAGHFPNDYQREKTRKLIFVALAKALSSISANPFSTENYDKYALIPPNKKLFFDVLIKNVSLEGKSCDIGVQFEEKLEKDHIVFLPVIKEIGDLNGFYGHREMEGEGEPLVVNNSTDIDQEMKISKIDLGNSVISLNFAK